MTYKIITNLLTPNRYSRPQIKLKSKKVIVIHWVANPKSTAKNNRDYFESLKTGKNNVYGCTHEIIDLNGDVYICVPEDELTYNCGSKTYTERCKNKMGISPNYHTYSIECTHVDWKGKMTDLTYNTLLERCVDLCIKFKLNPLTDIWLHKEVVGWKDCHKWFCDNPNEWDLFKKNVNKVKLNREVVKLFKDFDKISDWAKPSVERLEKLKILTGDENNNFNPESNITRQEVAVIIDRVLKYIG
jgi:N-acetylmuramoyl-L-alanine amidase CwlA